MALAVAVSRETKTGMKCKIIAQASTRYDAKYHVLAGDKVLVEMTPYDLTKGRITYRFK